MSDVNNSNGLASGVSGSASTTVNPSIANSMNNPPPKNSAAPQMDTYADNPNPSGMEKDTEKDQGRSGNTHTKSGDSFAAVEDDRRSGRLNHTALEHSSTQEHSRQANSSNTSNGNHRNEKSRNNQPSQSNKDDNKDRHMDIDSNRRLQQQRDTYERPRGSARGARDMAGERDGGSSHLQPNRGDRDSNRDSSRHHHSSSQPTASRHHQSKEGPSTSKDKSQHSNKDNKESRDNKHGRDQQANKLIIENTASASSNALSRPDPFSLLSITGRTGSLNPHKAFLGTSRVVDDFEKLNKIGEGTYGVVYRAKDKKTGEIVALKRIRMERESDGLPISSLREIKLLKTLRHDNIVLVKDVVVGNDLDQIFLVMEYCEQDLTVLMDNVKQPYAPSEVKCLMYQLLKGIEYCHDHYVIHRDLKLSNLLLNAQGILKIADFGLARSFGLPSRPMTPKVVTLWYRAPELLFGDLNYTTAVDMWSAGCIFGELLKHAPLLPGKVEKQQVDLIIDLLGTPHEKIWQGFNKLPMASIKLPEQRYSNLKNKFPNITDATRSLLSGLLTYDPKRRLSVKQALAHPYFIEAPPAKHPSLLPTHPEIRNLINTRNEENPKLKRHPVGEDTESISNSRKKMR